jgi:hypothetical protein
MTPMFNDRVPSWLSPLMLLVLAGCSGVGVVEVGSSASFLTPVWGDVVDGLVPVVVEPGAWDEVERVALSINGEVLDMDVLPPYELSLDTANLPDGEEELVATVQYRNVGPARLTTRVVVDNLGPSIVVQSPLEGGCVIGSLAVEADVRDDVTVVGVEFRIDGEPAAFFESGPYSFEFDIASHADVTLTVAAENERGLISNRSLQVDACL